MRQFDREIDAPDDTGNESGVGIPMDTISAGGQVIGLLLGHVAIQGWAWEIKKLEKAGIPCHMPILVNDSQGEYLWQIAKGHYKRACKILGGQR